MSPKKISIVTPCFNEELNVGELHARVRAVMAQLPHYNWEHLFIDNASTDGTVEILRELAANEPRIKVIVNTRNFGPLRSPVYGLLQASGDAIILLFADLQDPPELLLEMIAEWARGTPVVLPIKESSDENRLMFWVRGLYYRTVRKLAQMETYDNFTGFGLFDRKVIDLVRSFNDPDPFFRGIISEIGLPHKKIAYNQKRRLRGFSKNNLYVLYDTAMLGITNVSKVPLRLFTFFGFACAGLSILSSLGYLIYKLIYWDRFSVGMAPVVIGFFFLTSVQLIFVGILSEYISAIHAQVLRRPLTVEKERINFETSDHPGFLTQDLQAISQATITPANPEVSVRTETAL
ncbi:glycosyltransferase family 2 protein [Bryobacter aggregatus]|uniref:glycosyltransferase family 2 protein n=1 Tax=Bryobacter aggregatus TaxID=360054 RepID=UPI0009B5BD52|nr:glycosyltransferase family 2 protein [Bryobacter aggregatus]